MKKIILVFTAVLFGASSALANGSGETEAAESEAAAAGGKTLTIWDQFFPESQSTLMDSFIDEFEDSQPGVTVERGVYDTDAIRTVLRPALASGSGPDLFYYDAGPAFLGALVDAGLVHDLTDAYADRNLDESLVPWAVERVSYGGRIWGVPNEIEYTNVYVNLAVLDNLGLSDTIVETAGGALLTLRSLDDYPAILAAAEEAGLFGIAFANRDPGRGGHLFSYFVTLTAGKAMIDEILFGDGRWDAPEIIAAWELYQDLGSYYLPSANAISYDEGNAVFFSGQAATHITGTWLAADIMSEVDDPSSMDFILLPSADPALPLSAAGGIGSAFAVSSGSENTGFALDFLEFITTPRAGRRWLEEGSIIPPIRGLEPEAYDLSPITRRAVAGAGLPLAYNLDVVMPEEWNEAMKNGTQALLSGDASPAEVAAAMQEAWSAAKAEGRIWRAR